MASFGFGGTTQKCQACEKTVYLVEQITADNKVYHRSCFRCHHCKGTLKLFNFCSYEGVLYCKPHFDQLFKMTGSLDKFQGSPKSVKVERSADQVTNSRVLSMFAGTQEKCVACKKTVYPIEKVQVDGTPYHKSCFRCSHGGCVISVSNYVTHEQRLYCRYHHSQVFMEKGDFSQFSKLEQVDEKVKSSQPEMKEQVDEKVKPSQPDKKEQVNEKVKPFQPDKREQADDEKVKSSQPDKKEQVDEIVKPSQPNKKEQVDEIVKPSQPDKKEQVDENVKSSQPDKKEQVDKKDISYQLDQNEQSNEKDNLSQPEKHEHVNGVAENGLTGVTENGVTENGVTENTVA